MRKEVVKPASGKQDTAEIRYREKRKKLRKTIDKIADACIIEEVLYAGKRHLYLASAIDGKVCWHFFWL